MITVIPFIYNSADEVIANTYICCDENNNAFVVDPSVNNEKLALYLKNHHFHLLGILLTHAHYDHIGGIEVLLSYFDVPLYLNEKEAPSLTDPDLNLSSYGRKNKIIINKKPILLMDNEPIKGLNEEIIALFTPYHTRGSTCYYLKKSKILFSGDSLFKNGIGRYDLPGACPRQMKESLSKLAKLDDDVIVYPGHGNKTTIGQERKTLNI